MTGHPLDEFGPILKELRLWTWNGLKNAVRAGAGGGRVAATVVAIEVKKTKTGKTIGIVTLSDQSSQYEAILFSDALEQMRELFVPGSHLAVVLGAHLDGEEVTAGSAARCRRPRPSPRVCRNSGSSWSPARMPACSTSSPVSRV